MATFAGDWSEKVDLSRSPVQICYNPNYDCVVVCDTLAQPPIVEVVGLSGVELSIFLRNDNPVTSMRLYTSEGHPPKYYILAPAMQHRCSAKLSKNVLSWSHIIETITPLHSPRVDQTSASSSETVRT